MLRLGPKKVPWLLPCTHCLLLGEASHQVTGTLKQFRGDAYAERNQLASTTHKPYEWATLKVDPPDPVKLSYDRSSSWPPTATSWAISRQNHSNKMLVIPWPTEPVRDKKWLLLFSGTQFWDDLFCSNMLTANSFSWLKQNEPSSLLCM